VPAWINGNSGIRSGSGIERQLANSEAAPLRHDPPNNPIGHLLSVMRPKGPVGIYHATTPESMTLRLCKLALVAAVAFFLTLVVFNNLTDYDSNYHFVEHVLSMDTTFPENHGKWRALTSGLEDTFFYATIIVWESVTAIFCWWGAINGLRCRKAPSSRFQRAKNPALIGLTLSLLQWFVAFLSVGGEWFLMWQSKIWNGQDAAFRMFSCIGIVLILLVLPDPDLPPPEDS
jgi:predicted small integral membrane protein